MKSTHAEGRDDAPDGEHSAPDSRIDKREEAEDTPIELRLDLPSYAGPMDLLLDLVRDHEVDIVDIPVAKVTKEYLACVDRLEELDLEVGGEWLEMAAWLLYLKSRTLLPDPRDEEEEEGPDPREELVRRLIEYEKFKRFAEKLDERPKLHSEIFTPPSRLNEFRPEGPPELREAGLGDLMSAVKRLVDRSEDGEDFVYEMTREKLSLRQVILDIASALKESPRLAFEELFPEEPTRNRVVTTFLALLEMTRVEMVKLMQRKLDSGGERLFIERAVIDIVEVSQTLDLPED